MTSDLPDMIDARDELDAGIRLVGLILMASSAIQEDQRNPISTGVEYALDRLQSAKAILRRLDEEGGAS